MVAVAVSNNASHGVQRSAWKPTLIVFGVSLIVYCWTMGPTITYGGDCGDFISASYTLRNCHPTGYPLYLVIGRLVAAVPVGEIAARYNFLSALSAAIAVALVAAIVFRLTANALASALAGLSFAFFYPFWSQAVITEVYTMAAASDALLILLMIVATEKKRDWRWTYGFLLAGGFAFTHHLSVLFVFPPGALFIAWSQRRELRAHHVGIGALLFCVPLLLYLYLPIRSTSDQAINFWGDLRTPSALFAHMSLYRSHMFALTLAQALSRGATLMMLVLFSFFASSVFLLMGLFVALRRQRDLTVTLLGMIVFNLVVDLPYDVDDWIFFFFPAYVICAVFIGVGMGSLLESLHRLSPSVTPPQFANVAGVMILVVLALSQVTNAFDRSNFHGNRRAYRDTEQTLAQTAPGATLFVKGQQDELLFTSWYFQRVLGRFSDRRVVSTTKIGGSGEVITPRVLRNILDTADSSATYVAFALSDLPPPFHLSPHGRVCAVARQSQRAKPVSAWTGVEVKLFVEREVKRELLLPLTVRWQQRGPAPLIEIAFVRRGSRYDPPRGELPRVIAPEGGITAPQLRCWREEWRLHSDGGARCWEEPLACEVPGNALPGDYRIYVRLRDRQGSNPWLRAGQTRVIDL